MMAVLASIMTYDRWVTVLHTTVDIFIALAAVVALDRIIMTAKWAFLNIMVLITGRRPEDRFTFAQLPDTFKVHTDLPLASPCTARLPPPPCKHSAHQYLQPNALQFCFGRFALIRSCQLLWPYVTKNQMG